jgi:hypothetical protein
VRSPLDLRLGVRFQEWLSGTYWRLDAPLDERAIDLSLETSVSDLGLRVRDKPWALGGAIRAEGLATDRAVHGALSCRLLDEGRIVYRVDFAGDDGAPYQLLGHKDWSRLSPLESLTLLSGSIYDGAGGEVARCTLAFDLRADAVRWLKSLRARLRTNSRHLG